MDDIETYRQQLAQVQAAILTNPDDAELKKLEQDLKEVISLQNQLETKADAPQAATTTKAWKVGTQCEAVWLDGKYYNAKINQLHDDDTCTVTFIDYGSVDRIQISALKAVDSKKRGAQEEPVHVKQALTKAQKQEIQEAKKRKNAKKKARRAETEKLGEVAKSSWQSFNSSKVSKRAKTGFNTGKPKKSIFASPESVDGRVGVGTCGIGGKEMTDFKKRGKWDFKATE